mmetsp:Transcript_5136/g.14414  ORF Transcript_5136/g.14414 Transcript_5136/m.14414 type:complete len:319 (-) Transcript_5136:143-1099(-)
MDVVGQHVLKHIAEKRVAGLHNQRLARVGARDPPTVLEKRHRMDAHVLLAGGPHAARGPDRPGRAVTRIFCAVDEGHELGDGEREHPQMVDLYPAEVGGAEVRHELPLVVQDAHGALAALHALVQGVDGEHVRRDQVELLGLVHQPEIFEGPGQDGGLLLPRGLGQVGHQEPQDVRLADDPHQVPLGVEGGDPVDDVRGPALLHAPFADVEAVLHHVQQGARDAALVHEVAVLLHVVADHVLHREGPELVRDVPQQPHGLQHVRALRVQRLGAAPADLPQQPHRGQPQVQPAHHPLGPRRPGGVHHGRRQHPRAAQLP